MTQDYTGIRVGQQRNHVSVREAPLADLGNGTLVHPKPLQPAAPGKLREFRVSLGYSAVPATEVYGLQLPHRSKLQLDRISNDRYAVHVGAALINSANLRVAPLVQSTSGRGEPCEVEAGSYKIVISLGAAVRITDLRFALSVDPLEAVMVGTTPGTGAGGSGTLLASGLNGVAPALAPAWSTLLSNTHAGVGVAEVSGNAVIDPSAWLHGYAQALGIARGTVHNEPQASRLSAAATAAAPEPGAWSGALAGGAGVTGGGSLAVRPVLWQSWPQDRRRAWVLADGTVVLNRSYVTPSTFVWRWPEVQYDLDGGEQPQSLQGSAAALAAAVGCFSSQGTSGLAVAAASASGALNSLNGSAAASLSARAKLSIGPRP